jgi:hypothetical protein
MRGKTTHALRLGLSEQRNGDFARIISPETVGMEEL